MQRREAKFVKRKLKKTLNCRSVFTFDWFLHLHHILHPLQITITKMKFLQETTNPMPVQQVSCITCFQWLHCLCADCLCSAQCTCLGRVLLSKLSLCVGVGRIPSRVEGKVDISRMLPKDIFQVPSSGEIAFYQTRNYGEREIFSTQTCVSKFSVFHSRENKLLPSDAHIVIVINFVGIPANYFGFCHRSVQMCFWTRLQLV